MKTPNHVQSLRLFFSSILLISIGACSKDSDSDKKSKATEVFTNEASIQSLSCDGLRSYIFDGIDLQLAPKSELPQEFEADAVFQNLLQSKVFDQLNIEAKSIVYSEMSRIINTILVDLPQQMKPENLRALRRTIGALKVGDRSTKIAEKIQPILDQSFERISNAVLGAGIVCAKNKNEVKTESSMVSSVVPLPVFGIRKAMATAYQSCEVLRMNPVTSRTPDSQGVEDIGPYPGSMTGRLYKIVDQEALGNSHYYVKDFKQAPGCLNVKKYTMIYDFGGKPYTTSAADSSLNYWKDNGDGSKGLGIDCSGFVFTAHAVAGLRLIQGARLKAREVENYSASMYVNPSSNGLTCLKNASMGKSGSLKPGDVIASKYHVAMIERIGADPLAITKYQDCNRITYRDFDFVIAQSSPEHNEIGINKYDAREYLGPFLKFIFRSGLETFAKQACEAYQAGRDVVVSSGSFGVSRHKMTADCLQKEIKLEAESCISSCRELTE